MMSSKNSGFTAIDIENYHSGKMSPEERHALEKAALDDPFLADALEGYAFTPTPADDIAKIELRLAEKEDRKKMAPVFKTYRWLSVAAIFLIMVLGGWFAYKTFNSEKNPAIAQQNDVQKSVAPPPAQSSVTNPADSANLNSEVFASKNSDQNKKNGTPDHARVSNAADSQQTTPEKLALKDVKEQSEGNTDKLASKPVLQSTPQKEMVNPNATAANVERGYSNNSRLLNSQSQSPTANNSNVTNKSKSPDREEVFYQKSTIDSSALLNDRVAGIKTTDTIKNFNVVLQQQKSEPAEVVVVGYGSQKKSAERYPKVVIDTLEPDEGYVKFDDYVANNLKMPEEFKTKPVSGEVQLSFDVDKDGQPINITVVKSLCEKCDEEAVRLLKEGPKWKKKKNKKGKITIKF
jgi:TonB family protein